MRKKNEINEWLGYVCLIIFALCTYLAYNFFHCEKMNTWAYIIVGLGGAVPTALVLLLLHQAIALEKRWFLFEKGNILIPDPSYLPAGIYHAMICLISHNKTETILHLSAVNLGVLDDEVNSASLRLGNRKGYLFMNRDCDDVVVNSLQPVGDVSIIINLEWHEERPKIRLHPQSSELIDLVN